MSLARIRHVYLVATILAVALCFTKSQALQILNTFVRYDNIRNDATEVSRVQNIDVVTTIGGGSAVPICNLAMIMPFFNLKDRLIRPLENGVFQAMSAVMLAIEHLNTGNGTIVSEVEGLDQTCPIKFNLEVFDSGLSEGETVNHVINLVSRQPGTERLPCALLGASRSAVSIPSATISGLKGVPQISPISTSSSLDDRKSYPLFGRTIPSDAGGTAAAAILYLRNKLGVKNLAIMYVNDAYGDAYVQGLQDAAMEYAPDMKLHAIDFPFDITPEIVTKTVKNVKETQCRYIFSIMLSSVHYDEFMIEAYEQGIAGTGVHFWMFTDSVYTSTFERRFEIGSPLHLASKGCSRISAVGGLRGDQQYDAFIQSMHDLNNPSDIALIQSRHPAPPEGFQPIQIAADPAKFFAKTTSEAVVPFIYDATIALGLSACHARLNETYFNGKQHFEEFLKSDFHGVTGKVIIDPMKGTRVTQSARFSILNVVEEEEEEEEERVEGENTILLKTVVSELFSDGVWEESVPIIFNDGKTLPPPDLPTVVMEMDYIGWPLRIAGWLSGTMVLASSIYLAFWTHHNRSQSVVFQTQPVFLYMIAAGCFVMGIAIFLTGIDDQIASVETCSFFCAIWPWFMCTGWILAFSALYAKTKCINRFFHNPDATKKIKIETSDFLAPVLGFFTVVMIILLIWSTRAPPDYQRIVYEWNNFGQPIKSRGLCDYNDALPYAIVVGALFFVSVEVCIRRAYEARKVSVEFEETEYIVLTLFTICFVAIFGMLLWFLLNHSPGARFVVIAAIEFLISMSMLLLIFIPKLRFKKEVTRKSDPVGRIILQHGSSKLSITGLDFLGTDPRGQLQPKLSEGMIVMTHPKEVAMLKEELISLKKEYAALKKKNGIKSKPARLLDAESHERAARNNTTHR